MTGGDTFRLNGVADRHTWVVLLDPVYDPKRVLIVSFTSYTAGIGMDAALSGEPQELSILTNRSCIYYEDIREASVANLQTLEKAGRLQKRTPVSGLLLQRIRDGAIDSDECPEKFKEFLKKQGVVTTTP